MTGARFHQCSQVRQCLPKLSVTPWDEGLSHNLALPFQAHLADFHKDRDQDQVLWLCLVALVLLSLGLALVRRVCLLVGGLAWAQHRRRHWLQCQELARSGPRRGQLQPGNRLLTLAQAYRMQSGVQFRSLAAALRLSLVTLVIAHLTQLWRWRLQLLACRQKVWRHTLSTLIFRAVRRVRRREPRHLAHRRTPVLQLLRLSLRVQRPERLRLSLGLRLSPRLSGLRQSPRAQGAC